MTSPEQPDRVRSLVLADTTAWYGPTHPAPGRTGAAASSVPRVDQLPSNWTAGSPRTSVHHPSESVRVADIFLRTRSGAPRGAATAMGSWTAPVLPAITAPTLGARRGARLATPPAWRRAGGGDPDASLRVLPELRHLSLIEQPRLIEPVRNTCAPRLGDPMKPGRFHLPRADQLDEVLGCSPSTATRQGSRRRTEPDADAELPAGPDRHLVDINRLGARFSAPVIGRPGSPFGARAAAAGRALRELLAALPLLGQAIREVAHPQVRNRGTICGSLAHADPRRAARVMSVLDTTFTLARPGESARSRSPTSSVPWTPRLEPTSCCSR